MEWLALWTVWGVAVAIAGVLAWLMRGITFFGANTDNEKQIRAAARAGRWVWPSDMHKYAQGKAYLRDVGVLGVAVMQRLLKDRTSAYPLTVLCAIAHGVCAVLLFLVARVYWSLPVACLAFVLYVSSFWPYQIVLAGGYHVLAQMFLLACVFCLQRAPAELPGSFFWYGVSGVATGLMLFSSASGRKFIPLIFGAFLFSLRHARSFDSVLLAALGMVLGAGAVAVLLTAPNFLANIRGYLIYWNISQVACHFLSYRDHFARRGRPLPKDMRGAGVPWIGRFFWRIVPFHSAGGVLALGGLTYACFGIGFEGGEIFKSLGIILLSCSPVLYGELTRAPQIGRAYFPGFIGLLLLISVATFQLDQVLSSHGRSIFWLCISFAVGMSAIWNLRVFFNDVWPSRMAPAWLARALGRLGVKTFYTYDTPYNNSLVKVLPPEVQQRYGIQTIQTLAEVKQGFVVVPGTSAKSVTMEGEEVAIAHGDFVLDPVLNELLRSRRIGEFAVASFKTLGSSRIWVHESEVTSYRDLILKEISEEDRWRGRAWILDMERFHADPLRPPATDPVAREPMVASPC